MPSSTIPQDEAAIRWGFSMLSRLRSKVERSEELELELPVSETGARCFVSIVQSGEERVLELRVIYPTEAAKPGSGTHKPDSPFKSPVERVFGRARW